jgi:uncharacterized protein YndB with AHSA1/START domain
MTGTATANFPEIFSTRIFSAPPALVWQAWTEPERIVQWWGPDGFTTSIEKMDFREGGEWIFTMHGPDGTDYPNHKIFTEISHLRRIVFTHDGPPRHSMTITFEPHGQGTKLTMLHIFDSQNDYDLAVIGHSAVEGALQHLARLDAFLESTG